MNKPYLKKKTGFTLIETLVAITILMIAVAGPLTVAHEGLSAALVARDQFTASYLAQDAIEYISYARDKNIISGNSWLQGMRGPYETPGQSCMSSESHSSGTGCTVETTNVETSPSTNIVKTTNFALYKIRDQETGRGKYTHDPSNATLTPFSRRVYIEPVPGANNKEVLIEVIVTWMNGAVPNSITMKKNLYNE